jgi:hypothetical protein
VSSHQNLLTQQPVADLVRAALPGLAQAAKQAEMPVAMAKPAL